MIDGLNRLLSFRFGDMGYHLTSSPMNSYYLELAVNLSV